MDWSKITKVISEFSGKKNLAFLNCFFPYFCEPVRTAPVSGPPFPLDYGPPPYEAQQPGFIPPHVPGEAPMPMPMPMPPPGEVDSLCWKHMLRPAGGSQVLDVKSLIHRWDVPPSTWSLSLSDGGTDGARARPVCPNGRSRGHHYGDGAAGGDVPDVAGAHCVSALSAGHCYPHLPRCGADEHIVLPLLLFCGVSGARNTTRTTHSQTSHKHRTVCVCTVLLRCDLGCCLIPCLIDDLKDVTHTCPNCKGYIYTYKRIC